MPFSPLRIKYLLLEKTGFKSLTDIAAQWGYRFEELSMCIRQVPGRIYPELRIKISEAIGFPVDEVFGSHPLTSALVTEQLKTRNAA
jgi:hypothetical protein